MAGSQQEKLKVINDYAWNWFSFHAAQRMMVFRFFSVIIGVLAVGYYQTFQDRPFLALFFSITAATTSSLFWRLDLRTRELIKIGEAMLLELETKFNKWKIADVNLVHQANSKATPYATKFMRGRFYSYGQIFSCLFLFVLSASIVGVICALEKSVGLSQLATKLCSA